MDHNDDDDKGRGPATGAARRFQEFDCPSCNANNPTAEPFGDRDEILCNYCGNEYKVTVTEEGKLRLKEM